MRRLLVVALVLLVAAPPLSARNRKRTKKPPAVDPHLKALTDPLIRKLDDPSFEERERASLALMALGLKAKPALEAARDHPSPEVRLRVRRILLYYREQERRAAVGFPAEQDWPMLKRGPGRGSAAGPGAVRTRPGIEWVRMLPFRVGEPYFDAPLLAAGDRLVVVTRRGEVAVLHRATGKIVWVVKTDEPVFAGPVVAKGRIYLPGMSLVALDMDGGKVRWRWKTDYGVVASPLVHGGSVFAVEKGERMVALDPLTGTEKWSVRLPATRSAPVVVGDDLIVGTGRGVVRLRTSDGKRIWRYRSSVPVSTSPAVLADRIVVGDANRNVFALSLDRGRLLWRRRIPEGRVVQSPSVYGDAILFSTSGATFRALRAADGRDLWTRWVGCITQSSPCVAGGLLYFTAGPTLHAMQCADGDDAWRISYAGRFASPIFLEGRLHLLSEDGVLLSLK